MAAAAKRSSTNTELFVGTFSMEVGLYGTNAKPGGLPGFENAGPSGGKLKTELKGAPAPVRETRDEAPEVEPGTSDPLATAEPSGSPLQDAARRSRDAAGVASPAGLGEAGAVVDGEYRRVLVEEGTGEEVPPDAVRKGVRLDDGRFIDCTDQLAAIEARTKLDRIDIVAFIDSTRIRRQRVIGARYVGGRDAKQMAKLKLLLKAMSSRRRVAVVKYTLRARQYLGVIEADASNGVLVLLDLVWTEDWREAPAKARLDAVEVPEAQVEKMTALVDALADSPAVVDDLRDDAIALREELLRRAVAGEMDVSVVEPLPADPAEDDLEDALAASLAAVGKV